MWKILLIILGLIFIIFVWVFSIENNIKIILFIIPIIGIYVGYYYGKKVGIKEEKERKRTIRLGAEKDYLGDMVKIK